MTSAYLRKAARMMDVGADSCYCSASFTTIKALADESIPVTSHVGLIPSKATWTGGFKAVGKTADQALKVWEHVRRLEDCGALAAELEVVPDRIAAEITRRTPLIMLGMGAGPWADAQCLFAEDVLGCTRGHKPRHAKIYRNFRTEMDRLQQERIAAFGEFKADVDRGAYPEARHAVPVSDDELAKFLEAIG
ncbi:3-methyl-2-oxobutanoate hydroxymethyltransferase [Rubellimicrobium aerolatum]|uniref:3-methyl-2-oxobutanoate hydroxymethyltransferase n=1 Tax=Rubellimicrobium aerolatum TaxID=490979 RepID=A0ABW0SHE0_9RHOB|nr:3-methyl-2-oxobutanoate hydroxymethyltransferase [Rubellimicrobium aerolatum]MBP1807731.1 3-methyl-2-oxobutanoate hydroxymethyltransferase [Rubellimicrobium aerolatum]